MLVYSDTLTDKDLVDALPPTARIDEISRGKRPRKRSRSWSVSLGSPSNPRGKNTGLYGGSGTPGAATWDDYGWWMATLFNRDPRAIVGPYDGARDFHRKTDHSYIPGGPGMRGQPDPRLR